MFCVYLWRRIEDLGLRSSTRRRLKLKATVGQLNTIDNTAVGVWEDATVAGESVCRTGVSLL